jgi:protease-4
MSPEIPNNQQQSQPYPPFPPYYQPPKRRRWWIPVLIIGIIFLVIIVPVIMFFALASSVFDEEPIVVKNNSVLVLKFGEKIEEYSAGSPFDELFGQKTASFNDMLTALRNARNDDRIKGLYINVTSTQSGFAKNLELMDAIQEFRNSGKFVYSFIEMGTEADYMKALPADKIFMPQEGLVSLNGFGIEGMFMKGLFDKIGLQFHVEQFEDFKSAGESMSRRNFSDSAKKEYRVILEQRHRLFVDAVVKYRKLDRAFVNAALDRGLYTADTLKALGFVDSLMALSDFKEMLKNQTNKDSETKKDKKDKKKLNTISVADYVRSDYEDDREYVEDKQIAIIYGSGAIMDQQQGFSDEKIITRKLASYIKKARENDKIKAIILRIDSPGGSVMTSDAIWKEVMNTKGVKPIYASMSDVAASGGYYVSMACDSIIAHPATITGSIGVIASIPNISGMLGKLDITLDTMSTTASAQDLSVNYPFSKRQIDKLHSMIEKVYFRFVTKVADGRKITFDQARAMAKGRVWTGEDAKRIGLIDVLGGMQDAIRIAKARIGVSDKQKVSVVEYPRPEDPIEAIIRMFKGSNDNDNVSISKAFSRAIGQSNSVYAEIYEMMPPILRMQMDYVRTLYAIGRNEPYMFALPNLPLIQ